MTAAGKLAAARDILVALDLPRGQQNDRSAWVLLALGDLSAARAWAATADPILGVTPIMVWIADHYGQRFAPNSRETIRRFTLHQFVAAGLVSYNPDAPNRPINSPQARYQLTAPAVTLLRSFGSAGWSEALDAFRAAQPSLAVTYAAPRELAKVPVVVEGERTVLLSPGAHSELIRAIVDGFAPMHAPGAQLLYVSDTGAKAGWFDETALAALGVRVDRHGKLPDVVLHDRRRDWLILAESVTSHGPVNGKRHAELGHLFAKATAGLVFLSAFPDRATMARYLPVLAWETEVWIASDPTYLIHFNDDRFLGPHG